MNYTVIASRTEPATRDAEGFAGEAKRLEESIESYVYQPGLNNSDMLVLVLPLIQAAYDKGSKDGTDYGLRAGFNTARRAVERIGVSLEMKIDQ